MFKRPTNKAVLKWTYKPKILDGRAVARHGVKTTIRFNLLDERGRIIPE
jgi:protein TonB